MKTRLRISVAAQERHWECMLELPSDYKFVDSYSVSEAVTNLFGLHPDFEVLSVCEEQTTLNELPQPFPYEIDTRDAELVIQEVMARGRRAEF